MRLLFRVGLGRIILCLVACLLWAEPARMQRATVVKPNIAANPNNLDTLADGGFLSSWLVSTAFPSEVDADAYENFQRFNSEFLPEKDWLAPFGGATVIMPQAGAMTARTENTAAVGTLTWTPYQASGPLLDFAALTQAKQPGTAYAAAYVTTSEAQNCFLETDGFLGTVWLNGHKVYDGFSLPVQRVVFVQFQLGHNLLLARASGVPGDGWRKNWGWAATLRLWRARPVGASVWAGALRPSGAWQGSAKVKEAASGETGKDRPGLSEGVTVALFNLSAQNEPLVQLSVRTETAEGRALVENLAPHIVHEAQLSLPVNVARPEDRRRAHANVVVGPHRAEWEAYWAGTPPPDGQIFYLEGFHVDPVSRRDQRGAARSALSNANQYFSSLRADPSYGVYLSELDYLKPYDDTHAEDRLLLREAIRQGRVGTGGTYNQFNELSIGGEAIVRNILYGRGYHEGVLGDQPRALPLWDVLGHAPQISQIARKSGFAGVVWSQKITGFPSFFYDYALDGSRLLHRRVDYDYSSAGFGSGKNYSFDALRQMTERKFAEARSLNSDTDLRINAADFTPPWTNLAGRATRLDENRPRITVTGQAQTRYFARLQQEIMAGQVKPPVTSRDKLFFQAGVGLARSDLKVAQRLTENMTLTAERFGALAYLRGARYPDLALDKAWRQILFNSQHDAITGTSADNAFLDLMHGYREAYELSRDALDDALNFIGTQVDTRTPIAVLSAAETVPLLVYNPLAWPRTDSARAQIVFENAVTGYEVRTADGQIMPHRVVRETRDAAGRVSAAEFTFVARDVPSLGYRAFYVLPVMRFTGLRLSFNTTIENEFYRVTVNPQRGGAISGLYDKTAQREIAPPQGAHLLNEIGVLGEELTPMNVTYPAGELWTTGVSRFSSSAPAQVSCETGGGTQRLVITGQLHDGLKYRQILELHEGVRRLDARTELLDYRGRDELFTVNFPLNQTGGALVTEDRFGSVVRNSSQGFLDFRTNADKLVSGASVYPVYNWAEYGSGLTLKFTQPDGATLAQIPLRPVALVRPHNAVTDEATEKIVAALIRQGVSVTPFYDDNDAPRREKLSVEDTTMPRKLNDDMAYHSFRIVLGGPQENAYSQQICQNNTSACHAWAERLAQDGAAYLFVYDKNVPEGWPALPVLLIAGRNEADLARAVTQLLAPLGLAGVHTLTLPAAVIADVAAVQAHSFAPDYGVTLINGGTPATSLEQPDTLALLLMHTALWPATNLDFAFTPEHKTHIFTYALMPHTGDWRAAGTVRAGYEFNNPLIARQATRHAGMLPATYSFLSVGSENVILSALKPGGNPQADFHTVAGPRPLIARFYEAEGTATQTTLELPAPVTEASETDLTERGDTKLTVTGNKVAINLEGFGIHTYRLQVAAATPTDTVLGATAEPVQPVFSRYWLHNQGAAPLGHDPVKISLRPVEQMGALSGFGYDDNSPPGGITTTAVRVSVVNNYQDRSVTGTAYLETAPDWRVVPEKFTYDLAAGASMTQDIVVIAFPVMKGETWARASGLVKARMEHAGQTYQDVLEIGQPLKLEWRVIRADSGALSVTVRNPSRQRIEGALAFITPPETWADNLAPVVLPPREQGFSLNAGEEIILPLPPSGTLGGAWAVVRLSYNGYVAYLRADGRPVAAGHGKW